MGALKWGLKATLCNLRRKGSTIVHFCGLFGPLSKGNSRHKMTTIAGNLKSPFAKPPFTMRHKSITYPKKFYLRITVTGSELSRINCGKLPDTYCISVSCETLPT